MAELTIPSASLSNERQPDQVDFGRTLFMVLATVLLGFGLTMAHSASVTSWPTESERIYLARQLVFVAVGLAAAGVCASVSSEMWQKLAPILFWGTIALLILVMIPGFGVKVKGAQRWLRVAGLTLQPSELAKITLPIYLASRLVQLRASKVPWWRILGSLMIPAGLLICLVLIQPDLGTAIFLSAGTMLVLWIGGAPFKTFGLLAATAIPALGCMLVFKPYQIRRVTGFFETWADWTTAPYQLRQSLVTLGSGGWTGVGLGKGWQKLSFLPEANTDFVFAVVGEELGLVATLGLMLVWSGLFLAGLRILSTRDYRSFAFIVGFTLLAQLLGQAMLNIAVVTAMVPPKGISHPLVSCGGSNLVVSLVMLGIVYGISKPTDRNLVSSP